MSKNDKLKLGIVGWGGRGGAVARGGNDALGGMLAPVACVEPSDESYAKTSKRYELTPRRYPSVAAMLAKEDLDGVMIATPNPFHLENLRDLKKSGLPVLLEKPLESNFGLICDVVRFAAQYKAPVLVGHCMRYAPILQEAKKMLQRGDIGEICSVRFVQHCHYGNGMYHNWRRQKEHGGGMFIEKATHDFDIMLWFLETWPETVAAFGALQAFGGDKPADLRCRNCDERVTCPESIQNTRFRAGQYKVEELETTDDLCVFSSVVDAPDNEHALIRFANGRFGTYVQWFFSPRSYHHRIYEVQGSLGALEVDLGAEFGGRILFTPRYGTYADRQEYKFDYLQRNHYNGDGEMMKHFYQVIRGEAKPATTVKQAFAAEMLGYAADRAVVEKRLITAHDLLPKDLAGLYAEKVYQRRSDPMSKQLPADADVWVLAGQSNMAGSGFGEAAEEPSERVWLFSLRDEWDIARESFIRDRYEAMDEAFAIMRGEREKHFADPQYRWQQAKIWRAAGAGLGLRFGKRMAEYTGRPIGLIHCAKGDTRMEEWTPDYAGHPYMALYQATLRRIRKVNRPVKGILWDQGASDTFDGKAQFYVERMHKLVAAFRRDLNQPQLPFFFAQMGTFALQTEEELPDWNLIQEMQRHLEPALAPGGMTASVDLPLYDWGHISTAGLKRHGERFAKVVRRRLYGDTSIEVGPRPVAVERDPSDPCAVHVQYETVNDRLLPKDHIAGFSLFAPGSKRDMVCAAFVSPQSNSTVLVRTIRPILAESNLWYGKGLFPYCNLVDAADLGAPVFGPWKV